MSRNAGTTTRSRGPRTPQRKAGATNARTRASARTTGKAGSAARWPLIAGLVVAAVVSAVVVFAVRNQAPPPAAAGGGFGHVHGMAVDPATGALHVATHYGLYRVDGEHAVTRISKDAADLMGFTAAGPRHFLASGHPDADSDAPANLGLIESTDGGVTWRTMSLSGAADFHGLRAAHGAVYGYNSTDGAFMVSTDRRTWQRRSTVAMGAFAVSPEDPETVVGVGQTGLQRSTDGGRTWQAATGIPGFAAMAWDQQAELWGVAGDGGLWHSEDAGAGWHRRGQVSGEPHAIATHKSELYVAVAGDTILASTDGGATWTTRYAPA